MPAIFHTVSSMLKDLNLLTVFVRLFLAMLFGGIIGLDRARKRRPAGFRTYMLVCLGSALVMITNQYICEVYQLADPARLGAQVVSGVGFLGAGTIIITRHNQVVGLTTAAGLWASACMGLAIGIGFYSGAIITGLLIFFIIIVMHRFDSVLISNSRVMEVYLELSPTGKLSDFFEAANDHNIKITFIEMVRPNDTTIPKIAALITLRLPKRFEHYAVTEKLGQTEGVSYIEEI